MDAKELTKVVNKHDTDIISRQYLLDNCVIDKVTMPYVPVCRIENAPHVTLKPKTGHWIDNEFGSKCSCCGIHTHLDKFDRPMKFKYCSMCGAKMVESQEGEE